MAPAPAPTVPTSDVRPTAFLGRKVTVTILWGSHLLLIATLLLLFQPIDERLKCVLTLAQVITLVFLRVPVAVAMGLPGAIGIAALRGPEVMFGTFSDMVHKTTASWSLAVLPMFIMMGLMLWRSGATDKLYLAMKYWISWLPGGLAVATTGAGAVLASVSGSSIGISYALGRIGIPEMLKSGYDKRLTLGSILIAGVSGNLIPPSILLVIFASVAQVPVGLQLLAGVVPGVLLAVLFVVAIVVMATLNPALAPKVPDQFLKASMRERIGSLRSVWAMPTLVSAVLGGLFLGVFTATEAGAIGAMGACLIALGSQGTRTFLPAFVRSLQGTASATSALLFLLIGAAFLSRMIALSGGATWLVEAVGHSGMSRTQFLIAVTLIYLVMGMFLDSVTMIVLTVPVVMPLLPELGIDLLWYGVFVVLLGEVAMITPPIGVLVFVVHRLAQSPDIRALARIRLGDVFTGGLWLLPVTFVLLGLMMAFPDLVLWLPLNSKT